MTDEDQTADERPSEDSEPYTPTSRSMPVATGSGIRWRFPIAVVMLAVVLHALMSWWADEDYSLMTLAATAIWMLAGLTITVWWIFFSGASRRTRWSVVGSAAVGLVAFLSLFRMNGQGGNFVPQFAFRFAPSAEDRATEYFSSRTPIAAARDSASSGRLEISADDWPKFGGPRGDHIVSGVSLRKDWETDPPKQVWRHPIGPGWSSFAIVGDLVFTQEQRGDNEAVVCYDAASGEHIWVHEDKTRFSDSASGAGPRSTPTVHDSRLYALGATGILNCLDPLTGSVQWTRNIIEDADTELIEWGMAGAPLIHDGMVIVNPGGDTDAVAAYDAITGEKRWSGGNHRASYASPQVAVLDDVPQVIIYCSTGVCGHDLTSGDQLWAFEWTNMPGLNIAQPLVLPDTSVFISSGYTTGSARLDVTREGDQWTVNPRWERPNRFKLKFNGGIYRDGYVYGLDEGILSCFDLEEGERTWKRGRYKYGQILMVGDDLLVLAESGQVALVEVTPDSVKEVAKFQAIEGKTWNHPVFHRGKLYVRNGEEVACYDLSDHR